MNILRANIITGPFAAQKMILESRASWANWDSECEGKVVFINLNLYTDFVYILKYSTLYGLF